MAWIGISIPVLAVLWLNQSLRFWDFIKLLLCAVGMSLGISLLLLPPAIVLEKIADSNKRRIRAVPVVLVALSAATLLVLVYWMASQDLVETVFNWPGAAFGLAAAFCAYWGCFNSRSGPQFPKCIPQSRT